MNPIKVSVLRKGWSLLDAGERRQAFFMLIILVMSAFASALMVASIMPFLTVLADPSRIHEVDALKQMYRLGGFSSDYGFLVALGIASLAVIVVASLMQALRVYLTVKFSTMRMHSLSCRLLAVYLRQPYEFFINRHSGELGTQILSESQKIVEYFFRPAAEMIASGMTAVSIVVLLIWINPIVALATFVIAGGIFIGSFALSRKGVKRFGSSRAAANRERYRTANEALSGVKDVMLLGRQENYVRTYANASLHTAQTESYVSVIGQLPQYVIQIVAFGGMILLCLAMLEPSDLASGGALATLLPLLGVFAFAGQRLIPEFSKLYGSAIQLNYGSAAVHAIYDDLEFEKVLNPLPSAEILPIGLNHSLQLNDIKYSYPNAAASGLDGVSISINAGERVGIVGGSGSGKTTLADIIMGLLSPSAGSILVDGVEVTEDNLLSWQRSVGYVQQNIFLSDASILENIALGVPLAQIDRSRVYEAARMARLDDFVRNALPQGYDTAVGERGIRLSGGQRQRIGIARALYNHADLIVFDEATSALDNITEKQVIESIDALPGNKTAIMIAHRLSTLAGCHRLIVLDQGKVVGVGTWNQLLAGNPHFQRLALLAEEEVDDTSAGQNIDSAGVSVE